MINRELIRLKVLQLTYAFYQNGDKTIDSAEKELFISLSKAYDLYRTLLALIVALLKEGERRYEIESTRALREGTKPADKRFVKNRFARQLADNVQLKDFLEDRSHRWDEDEDFIKRLFTQIENSETYANFTNSSYDVDREFWRVIYKEFIMDNDDLDEILEGCVPVVEYLPRELRSCMLGMGTNHIMEFLDILAVLHETEFHEVHVAPEVEVVLPVKDVGHAT